MGNGTSDPSEVSQKKDASFIHNLQLYEELVTEEFGHIKVFKLNEKPFRYYMLYRESGVNEEKTRLRLQEKMGWYSHLKQHKNIVSVEYINMEPTQDMCIQKISLDIYAKYYNYTLDMAVASKLKRFLKFREADLTYVLFSLLSVGKAFNLMMGGQSSGWFNLKNIYITPEGHIKIYPFPLHYELRPTNGIHRSIQSPHKQSKFLIDNEQVVLHLSRKTSDGNSSSSVAMAKKCTQKDDLRDIGLVILQLLILNRETVEVKLYSNEKIINILNMLEKQGHINSQLKDIVIKLICNYKQMRYQELISALSDLQDEKEIQIANSIKLEEGTSIIQSSVYEKNENLKQLSQHKHLKAGCISIVSSHKKKSYKEIE